MLGGKVHLLLGLGLLLLLLGLPHRANLEGLGNGELGLHLATPTMPGLSFLCVSLANHLVGAEIRHSLQAAAGALDLQGLRKPVISLKKGRL